MAWVTRTNLKGPTGTIDGASTEELPPGSPSSVTLGGTPAHRTLSFGIPKPNSIETAVIGEDFRLRLNLTDGDFIDAGVARGPQGLPGAEALPADDAVAAYISTEGTSATKVAVTAANTSTSSKNLGLFGVFSYGAVNDFNGTTGTDNFAAFTAAIAATPEGGTLRVPAGRYFFSSAIVLDKSITFDTGAGGFQGGPTGTQLVFAPGVSGIEIKKVGAAVAPSKWKVGPFLIKSLSTVAGTDVGIFISAGRGVVSGATVEAFGSHGVHIKAGAAVGGGNANNTELHGVRAYGNRGDGIRLEGTDTNACLITKPDVVANYGWGINLVSSSMNKITAAHADQQYNGAPGAFRDAGNSNDWDWIYAEANGAFLIDTGSSNGRVAVSGYATPTISATGSVWQSWRIEREAGFIPLLNMRQFGLTGQKNWQFQPGSVGNGTFDMIQTTDSLRVFSVDSGVTRLSLYTDLRPSADAVRSLGSSTLRWVNGFFSSYVRVGAVATGSRPSAATAGAGAHMFDTTLGKPIWSDGSVWKDATGATV